MRRNFSRLLGVLVLLVIFALGLPARSAFGQSDITSTDTTPTLTTGGTVSYTPGAGAVLVASELTIAGSADALLDTAIVSISRGFVPTEDMLGISAQEGTAGTVEDLAWGYDPANGMMTLTGEANPADYQAALRQVTFTNTAETEFGTERLVTISLGSAVYYIENGHFYEFITAPRIAWTDAKLAAEAMTYAEMQGYLATITTARENAFVTDTLTGKGWIGATDAGHNKEWYWETGPEAGTHFFTQAADENGCGEGPAETQPPGDHYENWNPGAPEPNDFPTGCVGSEDYANISDDGRWNDWPESGAAQAFGYLVEYGGIEGEPSDAIVGTIVIQADEPSITIETSLVGDDPDVAISFKVVPEVEGCTAEQTISLPAGETSVDVPVANEADETACTYTVTETAPVGYTVAPDESTAVAVDGTAAFTNTQTPMDALPTTGSANSVLVILGFVLAGSGWFLLAERRRVVYGRIDDVEPINLLPDNAWTEQAAAPAGASADRSPNRSAFGDAVAPETPQLQSVADEVSETVADAQPPAIMQSVADEAVEPIAAAAQLQLQLELQQPAIIESVADEVPETVDAAVPPELQPEAQVPAIIESVADEVPETVDAAVAPEAQPEAQVPAIIESAADEAVEVTETIPNPRRDGGHGIVQDLLQLLEDLAER